MPAGMWMNQLFRYPPDRSLRLVEKQMLIGTISQAAADRSVRLPLHLKQVPLIRESQMLMPSAAVCRTVGEPLESRVQMTVTEAVNALAAKGAGAECLSVKALMPETADESEIRRIFEILADYCAGYALAVCSPQVQICAGLPLTVLCIAAFGGMFEEAAGILPAKQFHIRVADPGTQLVMTGTAGISGTGLLAILREKHLRKRFPRAFIEGAQGFVQNLSIEREARISCSFAPQLMMPVEEGGIFRTLWMLGQEMQAGFQLDLKAIPILQETIEICEWLDINPYQLYGTGALLIVTDRGEELCEALLLSGARASVLGRMTGANARILQNGEEARYLEKPQQDTLWAAWAGEEETPRSLEA